jgi:hypothetical protein
MAKMKASEAIKKVKALLDKQGECLKELDERITRQGERLNEIGTDLALLRELIVRITGVTPDPADPIPEEVDAWDPSRGQQKPKKKNQGRVSAVAFNDDVYMKGIKREERAATKDDR